MSMMFHTRWPLAAITLSLLASVIGAAHLSEVLMTQATLLGGLDSTCEPNATIACEPSVVDAVAWVRELKRAGAPHAFLPTLDRSHILPKLHPLDWGANFRLHTKLGHTRAFVSFLGFPIVPTVSQFAPREQDPHVLDNYKMPIEHNMRNVLMSNIIDEETALHFVSARIRFDPLDDLAKTAATTMEWSDLFAKKEGRYKNTMVFLESDPAEFAAAIHKHGQFPEIICQLYARQDSVELKNGTWLLHVKTTKSHLHRIAVRRASNTSSEIVNVTLTAQPLELPPAMRTDPQYVADRAMMKAEALIAAANNPVQGSTAGPMPPSTLADGAAICRRGECAMGNLWADAIRNLTGTDIAFFSGSWVKGPGWPAGNVLLRDIFASYAFIETAGKVTVLGLSLFELWNHSLGAAAFDPYLPTANAASRPLPQVSGMRVRYNLARTGPNGKYNRVVSIDVWDRALNEYRPLERLKKYTVSGPGFLMRASAVHSKYLKGRYKGEIPITPIERNVQDLFRDFLARTNGQYTPGIFGRMIEDNTSTASMRDWNHALVGCSTDFAMDTSINTCVPCPVGMARAPSASQCTPVLSNKLPTTTLIAILAGICVFVLLICLVLILVVFRWRRYKRTQYCPTDPRQPIAAFFVTVRNEVALRERYPATAHAAFKRIEDAVARAATSHHCFVARRLGAHFLVVSAAPANAVRAIAEVYRVMDATTWDHVLGSDSAGPRPTYVDNLRRSVMKTPQTPGPHNPPSVSGGSLSSRVNSQRTSSAHSSRHSARSRHYQQSPQSDHRISQPPDRAPKPPVLCPVVSAGVAFGTASITYDDELDTWVYAGPVVDAAASVADAARPSQFLATSAVVDAVDLLPDVGASFEEFVNRRMLCPLTLDNVAVALHQLNPNGCQHQHFEPVSSDSDTAGALTAALEVAASGITSRTIGVVCWSIPALRSPRAFESRADQARQLEAVLATLLEVSRECHASLTSATDGTFVAIVNGVTARTAQVTTTTAALARAGVVAVQCSTDLSIVASVVTGSALTGALMDTVVVSGTVVERSRLISTIAAGFLKSPNVTSSSLNGSGIASAGLSVFITCDAFSELDPHYVLAAVDAFVWPDSCTSYPQVAGGKSSQTPVSLYAVMEENGMADDEWLYQLAEANKRNPYSEGNAALRNALRGNSNRVDSSSAQAFARFEPEEHLPAAPLDPTTADSRRRSTVDGFPAGALSLSELRALIFELEAAAAHGGVMPEESAADCVQRRILDVLRTRTQRIVSRFTM